MSVYTEPESNIRGGFTSNVKGKVTFKNNYSPTYDLQKPIPTGIFSVDTTLYDTIFIGELSISVSKELGDEHIEILKLVGLI